MNLRKPLFKSIFIWIIILFLYKPTYAQSEYSSCPPSHEQSETIKMYLDNKRTWEVFINALNLPWAGDNKDPRPIPEWSFADLKKRFQNNWLSYPPSLIFAFESNRYKQEASDIIPIPRSQFWCIARAQDVVLLSDRITHHYTSIHYVDRENQKIYFLDPWPEMFFLKEDKNIAGVAAKIDSSGICITKDEFNKVAIGLLTTDTKEFIDYFITYFPDESSDPNVMFALSSTLLEHGHPSHVYISLRYLKSTLQMIDPKNQRALYYKTAQRLAFALARSSYLKFLDGDVFQANQYTDELSELFSEISPDSLGPLYSIDDYYKLGNLAGRSNDLHMAIAYYAEIIFKDHNHYGAYLYRALAMYKLHDYGGAENDATRALEIINKEIKVCEEKLKNESQIGFIEKDEEKGKIKFLVFNKSEALSIRTKAYFKLGKIHESQSDALEYDKLINYQNK